MNSKREAVKGGDIERKKKKKKKKKKEKFTNLGWMAAYTGQGKKICTQWFPLLKTEDPLERDVWTNGSKFKKCLTTKGNKLVDFRV